MECSDLIRQVIYLGIPIASVDSKESWALTLTHAGLAEYSCLKCLVSNCEQHKLVSKFKLCLKLRSTKSAPEKTLQQNELHTILSISINFFWSLTHSDPYLAISYDKLHADDLGKFSKHLWPLLLSVLEELNAKGQLTLNMHKVERWPNLKHFSNVITVDYADGAQVSAEHGKNFDFLKQHLVTHAIQDIEQKGTLNNYNTYTYVKTNCKNTEPQVCQ
ncbi:uncharacterized protein F5891DRAFT_1126375 [Suillus fuscotomentosus]|uniref:Uncharacterized protein n=1 Tax=Suillus fuscotomentosus TaxID=1912939 RepID=A0AAD4HQ75_9AGAM|nr:uncharacterized protein F5891DRAFT_1126375 [Suillus fuscotomentosus]KAG1904556.1 hypothetical protein F5891DRAFT_1126375 [Suillus fuscotomentosus]